VETTIGHKTVALLQGTAVQPVAIDTELSINITTTMLAPIQTPIVVSVESTTPGPSTPIVMTLKTVTPRPCFVLPGMLGGGQRQQVLVTAKPPEQKPATSEVIYQLGHDGSAMQQDPLQLDYHFVHNTIGEYQSIIFI
jgi:hypothetical protein